MRVVILLLYVIAGCAPRHIRIVEHSINQSLKTLLPARPENRFSFITDKKIRRHLLREVSKKTGQSFIERKDTLIYIEEYDNICKGCRSVKSALMVGRYVYYLENWDWKVDLQKSTLQIDSLDLRLTHRRELIRASPNQSFLMLYVMKGNKDSFNEKNYGSPCLDGANANLTWILPSLKAKSINVDCIW